MKILPRVIGDITLPRIAGNALDLDVKSSCLELTLHPRGYACRLAEVLLDLTSLMAPHTRNMPTGLRFPDTLRTCPMHAVSWRQRRHLRRLTRTFGDTTQAELVRLTLLWINAH